MVTENFSISRMERLYALLSQCIYQHREDDDKTELVKVNFLSCSPFCHMLLSMCVHVKYMYVCTVNITLTITLCSSVACFTRLLFQSGKHLSILQNHCYM